MVDVEKTINNFEFNRKPEHNFKVWMI